MGQKATNSGLTVTRYDYKVFLGRELKKNQGFFGANRHTVGKNAPFRRITKNTKNIKLASKKPYFQIFAPKKTQFLKFHAQK